MENKTFLIDDLNLTIGNSVKLVTENYYLKLNSGFATGFQLKVFEIFVKR